MIEINDDPERYKRMHKGRHVDQLRAFMASRKTFVKLDTDGVPMKQIKRDYNGLYQAIRRPEFRGLVTVKRYGTIIQLIRQG